jgi:hypothetical protein
LPAVKRGEASGEGASATSAARDLPTDVDPYFIIIVGGDFVADFVLPPFGRLSNETLREPGVVVAESLEPKPKTKSRAAAA